MREVPISSAFPAFPPVVARPLVFGNGLDYFALIMNGSGSLVVIRRDMDVTWRTAGALCRDRDWSKRRLLHELQHGLPYRTIPAGHTVDWHHAVSAQTLDLEASEVTILRGLVDGMMALDTTIVGIEVQPPTDAEVPATASVKWAVATTRRLRGESKIRESITKAELARLLEAEAQKAVRTGQLSRALKASYLENQLAPWGIWPLNSFK